MAAETEVAPKQPVVHINRSPCLTSWRSGYRLKEAERSSELIRSTESSETAA